MSAVCRTGDCWLRYSLTRQRSRPGSEMPSDLRVLMVETKGLEPSTLGLQRCPGGLGFSGSQYRICPLTCAKAGGHFHAGPAPFGLFWPVLMTKCLQAAPVRDLPPPPGWRRPQTRSAGLGVGVPQTGPPPSGPRPLRAPGDPLRRELPPYPLRGEQGARTPAARRRTLCGTRRARQTDREQRGRRAYADPPYPHCGGLSRRILCLCGQIRRTKQVTRVRIIVVRSGLGR
jgi:hypothetical protein